MIAPRLAGNRAIVTGGAHGIGAAIVEKLREEGARVAVFDIERVSGEFADFASICDVSNEREVERAVAAVLEAFGGLDILINNAGVNSYYDAIAMTGEEWDRIFAVDLKAAWLCSKYALPHLVSNGGGAIVNIASTHARTTIKGMFPYAAAKSGMVGLTRSLALDFADRNVRVNAVCPGWTRTRIVQEWFDRQPDGKAAERAVTALQPLGRIADPGEIANVVAFVASPEASFMTGSEVYVDGGLTAQTPT